MAGVTPRHRFLSHTSPLKSPAILSAAKLWDESISSSFLSSLRAPTTISGSVSTSQMLVLR